MKTEEVPDIVFTSEDRYKETLNIYVRKDKLLFTVGIDGVGQEWEVPKEYLIKVLK
jgi:hypothetical protein